MISNLVKSSAIRSPMMFSSMAARMMGTMVPTKASNAPKNEKGYVHEFSITHDNGFLPLHDPLPRLPAAFDSLNDILERMPVELEDGKHGLLYDGRLGSTVQKYLPMADLNEIEKADGRLLAALYRDYTFLASAYLLEPCDISYRNKGTYGLGRDHIPSNIAVPLVKISERLGAKPYMEYAISYALFNWKRIDPDRPVTYDNLRLIRKLHGGQAEAGFILVHVAMVAHTNKQVQLTDAVIEACENKDRVALDKALASYHAVLTDINKDMDTMWSNSDPKDYMKLRTFIMGTKDQPMFPKGVIYQGVSDQPQVYRGESGANDSIIPTCDNLFQLNFPDNPMTGILKEFRSYRPKTHEKFLENVLAKASAAKVRDFCLEDVNSAVLYLANIDLVREFRMRHWNFTKEYIIKHSDHPVATGGSPITTWLPNQLTGVLVQMENVASMISKYEEQGKMTTSENKVLFERIKARSSAQLRVLTREVAELRQKFGQ